ncbi:MAG: EscU/YscU/HrcU family type III secretion system export apparatus switch protein [Methylomonas sp.]|jgi:flagellar biosynthesis protein
MAAKTFYNSDIAVALKYDGKNAPKVTAKGEGFTAQQILEIAEKHGVPLQTEPELARVLAHIPLGEEIPPELYVAVAEVIAFAFYISGKTPESVRGNTPEIVGGNTPEIDC